MVKKMKTLDIRMFSAKFFLFSELLIIAYLLIFIMKYGPFSMIYSTALTQPGFWLIERYHIFESLELMCYIGDLSCIVSYLFVSIVGLISYGFVGYLYGILVDIIMKKIKNKKVIFSIIIFLCLLAVSEILLLILLVIITKFAIVRNLLLPTLPVLLLPLIPLSVPVIIYILKKRGTVKIE